MLQSRRSLIKNLLVVAGGVLVLPACVQDNKSKSGILLKNMEVRADEEALLAEIAETILPATDTPGAKDLYAHLFALKMIDDLSKKEDQQQFLRGLREIDGLSKKRLNTPFAKAAPAQREELLKSIETDAAISEDAKAFYKKLKGLTVQAYLTSKFYLTEVQPYKLTPGFFKGCEPVKPSNQKAYKV
jgi:hypothetical protein